jgi:CRP/FNR family cyclic AMP-dependent transcriptional regulator
LRITLVTTDNTAIQVRRTFERVFAQGDLIFEEDDAGDVLFIIQSGEVELSRRAMTGRHTIATLTAGEFFGEMCVVIGERRTARAVAKRDTRLLELDGETLEAMCVNRPEIAIRIISRLTARLIESERRLSALGIDDLLRPMVRALIGSAESPSEAGIRFDGNLKDLANESGLSMLEAHHALQQLLDRRVLKWVDDCLVAEDLDSLSATLETNS